MSSVGVGFSRGAGQSTIDNLQSGIPRVAGGILQDVPKLPEIGCLSLIPYYSSPWVVSSEMSLLIKRT